MTIKSLWDLYERFPDKWLHVLLWIEFPAVEEQPPLSAPENKEANVKTLLQLQSAFIKHRAEAMNYWERCVSIDHQTISLGANSILEYIQEYLIPPHSQQSPNSTSCRLKKLEDAEI